MVENHLTTCVESDTDTRSDCHAWEALLCYELPAVILGVRPAALGFQKVRIEPQVGTFREASAAQEILGLMLFEKQLQSISIVRHDAGIVMGGLC